jgi:hypothetical protein
VYFGRESEYINSISSPIKPENVFLKEKEADKIEPPTKQEEFYY